MEKETLVLMFLEEPCNSEDLLGVASAVSFWKKHDFGTWVKDHLIKH